MHGIWDSYKTVWWVDCHTSVIAKHMQRSPPSPKIHTDSHEKTQLKYPIPLRGIRQTWQLGAGFQSASCCFGQVFSTGIWCFPYITVVFRKSFWHDLKCTPPYEGQAAGPFRESCCYDRTPLSYPVICCRHKRAVDLEHAQLGIHEMNVRMTSPCRAALSTS